MKKNLALVAAGAAGMHIVGNLAIATLAATGGSMSSLGFLALKATKFMATPPALNVINLMEHDKRLDLEQEAMRTTATRVS